jgi:hypothetical protein
MPFEGSELFLPVGFEPVEPGLDVADRPAAESEDSCPRVVRDALVGDEAGLEEDPQVPAHYGRGRLGGGRELTRAARPVAQELEDTAASWIGEDREWIVSHGENI